MHPYIVMPLVRWYWRVCRPKTFGVKVLIRHGVKNDEILLIRHTYGDQTLWNIPGGGYNPKKESAEEAANREVKEELGVPILNLIQIGEYKTSAEGKRDTVIMFVAEMTDANFNAIKLSSEVAEVTWQNYQIVAKRNDVALVARRAIETAFS